ncbi:MAG: LysR family transcriptional regulator [Clostridia bacterium]|nr:LysR family transcriptional regulator [Clostridia bacterium]
MLKIEYFKYVIEVAKAGTINRAAENLFVSQPYLSLELKNLEHKLGVRLFARSNKGISLTRAGDAFLACATEICELAEKAEHIKYLDLQESELLHISSMCSFTMLDIYNEFARCNGDLSRIIYEEIPNEVILGKVLKGQSHIGVTYIYASELEAKRQELSEMGLHFVPLVREPLCVVLNKNHRLAKRNQISPEDLKDCYLILEQPKNGPQNSSIQNIIYPLVSRFGVTKPLYFDNNRSLLYFITKDTECYTVGQKALNLTNPFLVNGELVYIPFRGLRDELITGYVINENIPSTALQEKFIDSLEAFFADYARMDQ